MRSYLRPDEVHRLIATAGKLGRQGLRDQVLLQLIYRHALRVSEAVDARWSDFDLDGHGPKTYHVRRLKAAQTAGTPWTEMKCRPCVNCAPTKSRARRICFYRSEVGRLADMVNRIIERAGQQAGLGHVHPHMLRHSAGYMLANEGTDTRAIQAYLGHRKTFSTRCATRNCLSTD